MKNKPAADLLTTETVQYPFYRDSEILSTAQICF